MAEKLKGIPFDANEIILPDGSAGYDNVLYSADFAEWMQTYFKNGILVPGGALISTEMQATKVDETHVKVNSGNMVVNGRTTFIQQPIDMEIAKAGPNLERFDRIIVELNLQPAINAFRLFVLQGTMSSNPVAPTITRTDEIYQMSLALVKVNQSGVYEIVDERIDDDYCGISQVLIGVKPPLPVTGDDASNIGYDNSQTGLSAITVQEAIDELVPETIQKTLVAANWDEQNVQVLTISGFTPDMTPPIVDVIADTNAQNKAWGKIYKIVTGLDTLTFYAMAKIDIDLNIQVKV